ncbi:MAG: DUF1588 domain-containing protein [Myxococcales bacterium]|nr:DUF1588 domain-containing protein [Myxococcales bacterium]
MKRFEFLSVPLALVLGLVPACKGDGAGDGESSGDEADGTADGTGDTGGADNFIPAPGGMRRLLAYQYVNSIRALLGPEAAAVADPPGDQALHGYYSIGAANLAPALDLVELYESSALAIADAAVANPAKLATIAPCVTASPNQACYTEVAEKLGHVAWRRPLTQDEVDAIVDIALQADAWGEGDFNAGLKYELVRILLSPNFIYVTEIGVQDPNEPEEYWLTGPELVTRTSLLINGRIPSLATLEAAEKGTYDDPAALESLARALLADPGAPDALSAFFAEYLVLDEIPGKDLELFPLYSETLVDSMLQETEHLLRDVIWEQDADWRSFYDADYTFIDANLAQLYGMDPPANDWEKVPLPLDQARAGFLTHASVLARNAHGDGNSTTRRGQYIQQRMLCYTVPPPPPEVNPQLPEVPPDTPMTLREIMEMIHLEPESCATCHVHMDTLGFPLENFDALGAWRTTEANGLPIDPVAEYEGFGVMNDAVDLATSVAMDPRTTRCLVDNLIRFGRGALEDKTNEADPILALYDDFEASSFRVKELIVAFVTSELFRQVGEAK